jgi:hypothetical protein
VKRGIYANAVVRRANHRLLVMAARVARIVAVVVMYVMAFFDQRTAEEYESQLQQEMREILKRADQESAGNEEK